MRLFGLEITRAKRVVGERPAGMTHREVVGCFSSGPSAPLWKGINALIDEMARERVEDSCDPELPDNQTKFAMGGVDFGVKLKERAMEYFHQASQEKG